MTVMTDTILLVLGLVFRYICYQGKDLIPWYLRYFIVHSTQLSMPECVFLYNRGDSYTEQLPPDCPPLTHLVALPFSLLEAPSDTISVSYIFPLLATLGQLVSCLLLRAFCSSCWPRDQHDNVSSSDNSNIGVSICNNSTGSDSAGSGISAADGRDNNDSSCGSVSRDCVWPLPALVYWLSPVSVLSASLSPLPGLSHALFLAAIAIALSLTSVPATATATPLLQLPLRRTCLLASATLLLALQPESLPLMLLLFLSISINQGSRSSTRSSLTTTSRPSRWGALLLLLAAGCGGLWWWSCSPSSSHHHHHHHPQSESRPWLSKSRPWLQGGGARQEYFPGFGVMWYLQAQVFANYADYFSCFMRLQPLVYVGPLAARLPDQPLVSAFVLLAITLLLCRRDASCSDLVLVLCCFATAPSSPTQSCTEPASSSHPNTTTTALPMVQRMRYLSLLAPLLLVSCAGTPLMLLLWVQRGTGNANFVFFLGLGYSVAIIIGVVEFTRSAMRQRGRGSSYW